MRTLRRCSPGEAWAAVYGAAVAIMVRDHFAEGRGAPSDAAYGVIVEEAASIANAADQAYALLRKADRPRTTKGGG